MKSLLKLAVTIGSDILKAFEFAAPLVAVIDPPLAPVLMEVAQVVAIMEGKGQSIDQNQLSSIIQSVVAAHIVKKAPGVPETPAVPSAGLSSGAGTILGQ